MTADTWTRLVERAAWAPSPHNTQPWLVRALSADEAELCVPAERTLPQTDRDGAFITSTLGIFVEALDVAAAAEDLAISTEPLFPNLGAGADPRSVFARLQLGARAEPCHFPVDLLERRRTARGRFDRRPAAAGALASLAAIAADAGHEARFTSERALVDWVVGLNADTLFYDLGDDLTRAEIGRWVRGSNREARERRDGFSPACLGFPGPLVSLFFFHHRLFASRAVRRLVRRFFLWTTRGTTTVGWIQGPWASPRDHYEAGRMLMRFWLELTQRGLYLQPFGSVITNPTAHALMAERLQVDESHGDVWLLLRIGYCPPPPRSLRRRVAEMLE